MEKTLTNFLANLAENHGAATALLYEGQALTFAQLYERSQRLAGGLREAGVQPGDRVAIWLPNTFAWLELEFALARLGAVAIAINTKFRAYEVEDILSRSNARALVMWPGFKSIDFLSMVATLNPNHIAHLETLILYGNDGASHEISLSKRIVAYDDLLLHDRLEQDFSRPDAPCNSFTSSGTTARPKLILHSQRGIVSHAQAVADRFSYRAQDCVVLCMLPICGVFGFNTIMGALASGSPTILQSVFNAAEAVSLIEQYQVTHTNGSHEMLDQLLSSAQPISRIASLREAAFANFSGDAQQLVADGDRIGKTFFQPYGSSEVQALMAHPGAGATAERRALAGGFPVSNEADIRVRNIETGEIQPSGQPGELEIHGPNIMIGYIGNPEAEKAIFSADGYIRTGDLGYLTGSGDFVYLTRLGDTLRLGGFLVSPLEIETYLETMPEIAAAQVVGIASTRGTQAIGFVIMQPGHIFDETSILSRCQAGLAKFKVPQRLFAVQNFPITSSANGEKIQRAKLREMAEAWLAQGRNG